jgi:hypothetical protein
MTILLTFATALAAGWVIDRLAFHGDLTAMIVDEISMARARRKWGKPRQPPRRRDSRR